MVKNMWRHLWTTSKFGDQEDTYNLLSDSSVLCARLLNIICIFKWLQSMLLPLLSLGVVHKWRHGLRRENVKDIFNGSILQSVMMGNGVKTVPNCGTSFIELPNWYLRKKLFLTGETSLKISIRFNMFIFMSTAQWFTTGVLWAWGRGFLQWIQFLDLYTY